MTTSTPGVPQRRSADSPAPALDWNLDWNADALAAQLAPLWPGIAVEVVASTGSTNSDLLARGRAAGAADLFLPPRLLVAERQTGGRGRLGRAWQSRRRASLTCSLALPFEPADWSGLSLAVGVALADALDGDGDGNGQNGGVRPRIRLKWPNDLWLVGAAADSGISGAADDRPGNEAAGRKLGGILIETLAAGTRRLAVIGIGLNVLPFAADGAPPAMPMAFLSEIDARVSAPRTLARLMPPLLQALRRFEHTGFAAFASRFAARDALAGRTVRLEPAVAPPGTGAATDADGLVGTAEGVNAAGALRVRMPQGRVHEVVGGEVSVRLSPASSLPPTADQAPPQGAS